MRENGVKLPVQRHCRNGPWTHECRLKKETSCCVALLLNQYWILRYSWYWSPVGQWFLRRVCVTNKYMYMWYYYLYCSFPVFILFISIFLSLFYHYLLWYFLYFWASVQNGQIAMWPNTRVFKCEYHDSQKWNGSNSKNQWYNVLLAFKSQFRDRLY